MLINIYQDWTCLCLSFLLEDNLCFQQPIRRLSPLFLSPSSHSIVTSGLVTDSSFYHLRFLSRITQYTRHIPVLAKVVHPGYGGLRVAPPPPGVVADAGCSVSQWRCTRWPVHTVRAVGRATSIIRATVTPILYPRTPLWWKPTESTFNHKNNANDPSLYRAERILNLQSRIIALMGTSRTLGRLLPSDFGLKNTVITYRME